MSKLYTPDSERSTAEIIRRGMASMERWRKREAEQLRRLCPQPSPLQRLVEEIQTASLPRRERAA
jgi:hypothetical protein